MYLVFSIQVDKNKWGLSYSEYFLPSVFQRGFFSVNYTGPLDSYVHSIHGVTLPPSFSSLRYTELYGETSVRSLQYRVYFLHLLRSDFWELIFF